MAEDLARNQAFPYALFAAMGELAGWGSPSRDVGGAAARAAVPMP